MPRIKDEEKERLLAIASKAIEKCNSEKNRKKGHWSGVSNAYLLHRLREEVAEIGKAEIEYSFDRCTMKREEFLSECYDVINFALFIADNLNRNRLEAPE